MTYKEAYDKIIQAYFKDEIKPYDIHFCFCGTLSPDERWHSVYVDRSKYPYSCKEYDKMEKALLWPILGEVGETIYEHTLFKGVYAALEVLKQIHIKRGESVEEEMVLEKRRLNKELVL